MQCAVEIHHDLNLYSKPEVETVVCLVELITHILLLHCELALMLILALFLYTHTIIFLPSYGLSDDVIRV